MQDEGTSINIKLSSIWIWLSFFIFITGRFFYSLGLIGSELFSSNYYLAIYTGLALVSCALVIIILRVDLTYKSLQLKSVFAAFFSFLFSINGYLEIRTLESLHEAAIAVNEAAEAAGLGYSPGLNPEHILELMELNNWVIIIFVIIGIILLGLSVYQNRNSSRISKELSTPPKA